MITFAGLRGLPTTSIGTASGDYDSAGNKLRTAASHYRSHVVAPIDSRHVWRGTGRGHAETVTRVERLALATAGARMRTVAITLDTLQFELAAAKKELQGVIDDARSYDYTVDDTGTVKPGPTHSSMTVPSIGGVDSSQVWGEQQAAGYEARMKVAVRRAQRATRPADSCSTPSSAHPSSQLRPLSRASSRAKEAYETARGGELYASLLHKLLVSAHRQDGYATAHKEYGYPDHGIGVAKGLWDSLRDVLGLIALIGLAASGDANAGAALRAIPVSTWKQLSTFRGWEDLGKQALDWKDLKEGRPGEFVGNDLTWLLSLLGAAKAWRWSMSQHKNAISASLQCSAASCEMQRRAAATSGSGKVPMRRQRKRAPHGWALATDRCVEARSS